MRKVHYTFKDSSPQVKSSEILYEDSHFLATRKNLSTFEGDSPIDPCLIDIWSFIQNENELFRNRSDVHRVFFSSQALLAFYNEIHDKSRNVNESAMLANNAFMGKLDEELGMSSQSNLKGADLVFFHVKHSSEDQFLICFNFKLNKIDVLDHRIRNADDYVYTYHLQVLKNAFRLYLEKRDLEAKAKTFKNMKPRVVKMHWKSDNVKDGQHSGVYVMRHMELFKGVEKGWDVELKKDDASAIYKLRVGYCHKIMTYKTNRIKIQKMVQDYEKQNVKKLTEVVVV